MQWVGKIPSSNIVKGDIVVLDAGDYVPVDLCLIKSINLKIDESALTGESFPTEKDASAILDSDSGVGDRINSAFMGTVVTYGRVTGVIVVTGSRVAYTARTYISAFY